MADFFSTLLTALGIVAIIWGVHAALCDDKTYRQRTAVVKELLKPHNHSLFRDYYDAVSYEDHHRALMRFEDPAGIYPEAIQPLIRKALQ